MNKKRILFKVSLPLTILVTLAMMVGSVGAASVAPMFVEGNPSCTALGYDFGMKWNYPTDSTGGTYPLGSGTVTWSTDGTYVDWSSTFGVDAVIMKGGPNANVYVYDPPAESYGDSGLVSPNNASGGPAGLSHVEFCFDYEVTVSKTANPTYTRTFTWEIDKSVTPAVWNMFTGDSGTSEYTVEVTKDAGTDSDWAVSGAINIANYTPFAATITNVSDVISGIGPISIDCGVTFPYVLAAGGELVCTYSTALPNADARLNTATVTTSGIVGGGAATAGINFGAPTTVVNGSINVDDTYAGDLGEFGDSGSVSYSRTFTCDGDEGEHGNTATIIETGQESSASVDVYCYELMVTKDADTAFTRTWDWTIDKSADQTDLLLSDGQLFTVNYTVVVDAMSVDSDHAVAGSISVYNPAPMAARLNSVTDVVSPAIVATVDCGVTFPYDLASMGTLTCTYAADLPSAADRLNTATAALQNYEYDSEGIGSANGSTNFTGTANVSFAAATMTEIDECIDVDDTNVGSLGVVCASAAPKTFNYALTFGKHVDADVVLECEENTHVNIASFETNDTASTGSDSWTVNADVACLYGCTLTQGYWKTHSQKGPAPYDDAWKNLSILEESTPFFLSGKTWYQVFWTPPAGNPYYNLAHQYMAAKLNILNGAATMPAVTAAISNAETFFWTKLPSAKLSKTERANVLMWAATLDQYNNGYIGPGHCDE